MRLLFSTLIIILFSTQAIAENTFRFQIPQPSEIKQYSEDGGSTEGPGFGGGSETGSGLTDIQYLVLEVDGYYLNNSKSFNNGAVINEIIFNKNYTTFDDEEYLAGSYYSGTAGWNRRKLNDGDMTSSNDSSTLFHMQYTDKSRVLLEMDNPSEAITSVDIYAASGQYCRTPKVINLYTLDTDYNYTTHLYNGNELTLLHSFTLDDVCEPQTDSKTF